MKYLSAVYLFAYFFFQVEVESFVGKEVTAYVIALFGILFTLIEAFIYKLISMASIFNILYMKVLSVKEWVMEREYYFIIKDMIDEIAKFI